MQARVTILEVAPDRFDDATRFTQEQVLPRLQQLDGFEGMVTLGDRQSGRVRGVAFWESEEALHASEDAASRIRGSVAEATGGTVASVENCEVSVFEVASAGPVSGVADTLGGVTDKLGGATGNLLGGQEKKRS